MDSSSNMTSLSTVLKRRRKELGLTLAQIAAQMEVAEATVQRWESGNIKTLRHGKIAKLAEILGVTPATLMGWEDPALPSGAVSIDFSKYHTIPILGRVAAGLPIYAEENIEGYTLTDLNGGAEYFALRVKGDSMNGFRIHDGDIVIVRRQDVVENGEAAVVLVGDNDATIKRFYATNSTVTLMPQSTNPVHQPQMYDTTKVPIKVLGKVIEVKCILQ